MGGSICKPSREEFEDSGLWDFCGRKKEMDTIVNTINSEQVKALIVHGPKQIGKSRVIKAVLVNDKLKQYSCSCYIDFDLFSVDTMTTEDFIDTLKDFCKIVCIQINDNELTTCKRCKLCQKDIACDAVLSRITKKFIKQKEKSLVCFDNADKVINSDLRETFQTFLNLVTEKRKNIKLIVTSTTDVHMNSRAKKSYFLDKMEFEDLKELLVQVYNDAEVSKSLSTGIRDPWLNSVTKLCDGIPRCAETIGTMLKEDDGLIKPVEMVELLLTNFLSTLNPELFPKDDRPSATYQQELKGFTDMSEAYQEAWLYNIADEMKDSEITVEEALNTAQRDGVQVTSATFKMHGVRKFLDYCIVEKGEKASETLSMKRLYKHLLSNVCDVVEENKEDGLIRNPYFSGKGLQLMKEEAKRIDLDLDNVEKLDAVGVEKEIKRVDRNIRQNKDDKSSGEETGDSGHSSTEDDQNDNNPMMENLQSGSGVTPEQSRQQGDSRFDSRSGPYAMSYIDQEDGLVVFPRVANRTEIQATTNTENLVHNNIEPLKRTPSVQDNETGTSRNGILRGPANCHSTESETENTFLRSGWTDVSSLQKPSTLSNSFPTTYLRQAVEHSEIKWKRDPALRGHQICPTALNRMGSEDYEDADIPNNYVSTTEASDTDKLDNPIKDDTTTRVRYSGSSTDSGETRLSLEIEDVNTKKK